jgi:uncharacterized membrane protein
MFCTQCGTDISEKDRFCPACGKPSSAPAAPPQQSYTPPPPPPPPVQRYAPPPPPPPPQAPVYQEPPRYAPPPPPPPPPVYSQPPPAYPQAPGYPQQPGYPPPPPYGAPGYQMEVGSNSKLFAALAYLIPVIGPVLAIMQGKGDKFVLFHGWQAAIYDGVIVVVWIISFILMRVAYILGIIFDLVIFGIGILALVAFIQALMGKIFKIPVIGQFADRMSGS